MTTARQGSAFLLCLALAAFAAMVGYAFLRSAARQTMSGKSELLIALAQDAAQSGLAHATEQILLDYNSRSLELATGSGAVTVSPVPMHLDGPYRAPFVSLQSPNRLAYANVVEGDDVGEENHLMKHSIRKGEFSYAWWHDWQGGYQNQGGGMIYDARGRFIELNYYNITRPSPVAASPVPVATTRFKDSAAAKPERSNGLFLDESLRRLTSGTVEDQRRKARYRLRYAVGVEDLNAHLLTNPRADMDIDWKHADNDYRNVPRWIDHGGYVLENMVSPWGNSRATAMRFGHVFRGRGNSSNCDRAWEASDRNGLPASFPMMYREGTSQPWFGTHNFDNSGGSRMGGQIFGFAGNATYPAIAANPAGGEILTPVGLNAYRPYAHALVGPQLSWLNQVFAIQGTFYPLEGYQDGKSVDYSNWSNQWSYLNSVYTPFGRSQQATAKPLADRKWYEGNLDHPWMINLLTVPPQVVSEMLLGYIPPYVKTLHYVRDTYYRKIGEVAHTKPDYIEEIYDVSPDPKGGAVATPGYVDGSWDYAIPGLDVLNEQAGTGFTEFPAPANTVTGLRPDYYEKHPTADPRPVEQRYPGPLGRGDPAVADQGQDDFGQEIDVDTAMGQGRQVGWCTHTYNPLLFFAGGDLTRYESGNDHDGKPAKWWVRRTIDPLKTTYKYSYFWDLLYAVTTTVSYAKAVWVQYPNGVFDPRATAAQNGFADPALRDPTLCDSSEKIDALFLRQMGEDFDNPGSPCPAAPIVQNKVSVWAQPDRTRFWVSPKAVSNTIHSLVTKDLLKTAGGVSSAERGKVMERMLNDWRMSFFGASPTYDGFRPLDFDGDGHVTSSCYDPNPVATPSEKKYRTDRWQPVDGGAGKPGRGPRPTNWFSITGSFYIGKSHYFRVFTRGEVYDNLLKKPVAQQDLESVLVVDPEAPLSPPAGRISTEQRLLYKRWHHNDSVSELPLQVR